MSNKVEVATAGAGHSSSGSLSDAEAAAFWAGIVANHDAARRMARQFVSRQDADDVVTTAAVLFIESLDRTENPAPFPKTADELRGRYLAIVRNHALDCVRDGRFPDSSIHAEGGMVPEPVVGGRKLADRPLDQVFARNDRGKYDAPAPDEQCAEDELGELREILRGCVGDLSPKPRQIIEETWLHERKRSEVARRLAISVNTYDSRLKAAYRSLRQMLKADADASTGFERSRWYDVIEELHERYVASHQQHALGKKGEPSSTEGDASNHEGNRRKNDGDASNHDGDGRKNDGSTAA